VFAVAITLLILNVQVPHVQEQAGVSNTLVRALLDEWPNYLVYVISFLTVGITWINHHQMFRYISHADHGLLVCNTLLLLLITTIPFPTALMSEYIAQPADAPVVAFVYGLLFLLLSLAFNLLWWYGITRGLMKGLPKFSPGQIGMRYVFGPIMYGGAMLLSFANAWISLTIYVVMAIFYLLPNSIRLKPSAIIKR